MVNILVINGSPRQGGNSSIMSDRATRGIAQIAEAECRVYEFAGKTFQGCRGVCHKFCGQRCQCLIEDDLHSLWEAFLWADGIVWVVPVYHVGPPGQVKCAMDRLCNMQWSYFKGKYPRWNKAVGAVAQGSSRWGGQELAIQWLIESAILMKCIPIAGDPPASYFGVAGYAKTWDKDSIQEDQVALEQTENIARRVTEMAAIIRNGVASTPSLEGMYYPATCLPQAGG